MTNNPDTLKQILLKLNVKDLINACNTSIENRRVCETESFWRDKYELEGIDSVEIKDNFVKNIFQLQHIKLCESKAKEYIDGMWLGEYIILVINSVNVLETFTFLKLPLEEIFYPKIIDIIINDKVHDYRYLYKKTSFIQFELSEDNKEVNLTIIDPFNTYKISLEEMEYVLYLAIYNGFVISYDINSHREYFS